MRILKKSSVTFENFNFDNSAFNKIKINFDIEKCLNLNILYIQKVLHLINNLIGILNCY